MKNSAIMEKGINGFRPRDGGVVRLMQGDWDGAYPWRFRPRDGGVVRHTAIAVGMTAAAVSDPVTGV